MQRPPLAPPTWWRRRLYVLMFAQEQILLLLALEVPIVALVLLYGLLAFLLAEYVPGITLVAAGYAAILAVGTLYRTVGSSPGYVAYLASQAAGRKPGKHVPLEEWEMHVTPLRRLGGRLSGGAYSSALYIPPPPLGHEKEPRPEGIDEVMRAIELGLVEESATLPAERRSEPFARYAADVADAFGRGPITLDEWRSFLLGRYWGAPEACRTRAREHPMSTLWGRIGAALDAHPWVVSAVVGAATVIAAVVGYLRR